MEREIPQPGPAYPRVPGHEVAGVVDEAGPSVTQWKPGQRVGVAGTAVRTGAAPRAAGATRSDLGVPGREVVHVRVDFAPGVASLKHSIQAKRSSMSSKAR